MILLDTDHVSILKYREGERFVRLSSRLVSSGEAYGTTIISVEENMRGWMAVIGKERKAIRQVPVYRELWRLFEFFGEMLVIPFDSQAATRFDELRNSRL